jgi:hypothetical protein
MNISSTHRKTPGGTLHHGIRQGNVILNLHQRKPLQNQIAAQYRNLTNMVGKIRTWLLQIIQRPRISSKKDQDGILVIFLLSDSRWLTMSSVWRAFLKVS